MSVHLFGLQSVVSIGLSWLHLSDNCGITVQCFRNHTGKFACINEELLFATQAAYNRYNDNEHAKTDMYIEHYINYW